MSWMEALRETYDNCLSEVGVYRENDSQSDPKKPPYRPLVPIYHTVIKADITITLDMSGNFIKADEEDKKTAYTIIPVTENSAGRSSNVAAHPLCDNIQYVAGDYAKYIGSDKDNARFADYKANIEKWYDSPYCTDKIRAIYSYISRESMISDIINCGIFKADKNGDYNIEKKAKMNVRFKVIDPDADPDEGYKPETWQDKELFESFIKLYDETVSGEKSKKSLCYSSGEEKTIAANHPKNILATAGNAKLISANSAWIDLVWGGRFKESSEASEVSYESSQKAHNALSWLIANQGYKRERDNLTMVSWCVGNKEIPDIGEMITDTPFENFEAPKANTEYTYAQKINEAIMGYQKKFNDNDRVVFMSAKAATNGRLSIKHYGELKGSEYFCNLKKWYDNCSWIYPYKDVEWTPSPRQISQAAYGVKQGNFVKASEEAEKSCIERILPCIIEGRPLPFDIMRSAVKTVSRGEALGRSERNKIIATTCAIIKKYYNEKGVEITMELNDSNDRSYLFGRLLAVAEALERSTYNPGEDRATNAERYWSSFAQRPAVTWAIIQERLRPYVNKTKYKAKYEKLFEEIHSKFVSPDEYIDNRELSPMYVLGYWCQKNNIYKSSKNSDENKEEE